MEPSHEVASGELDIPAPRQGKGISTLTVTVLRKLIDKQELNGHVERLEEPWRDVAEAIQAAPPNTTLRERAFRAAIHDFPEKDQVYALVFQADLQADLDALLVEETQTKEQAETQQFPLTDLGNARRFAQQHAGKVYHTQAWGWMAWTGKRWERDETGLVMRLAKETVDQLGKEVEEAEEEANRASDRVVQASLAKDSSALARVKEAHDTARRKAHAIRNWAIKSQSRARLDALISHAGAQSEVGIATRIDVFDQDPWLLNVENGILDLRTGTLSSHDPNAHITRLTRAAYDPNATCPTWEAFLRRIFAGDQELIGFVQRAVGYSLTGITSEQVFFFQYGGGSNGKSTFSRTIEMMLGDYAKKTRAQTLMMKRQDSIPEDIARLAGVRFALAAELSEGMTLDEALIKDLTGEDTITARYLYHDSFDFHPVLKLWLYGNHKPAILGTDEGIWRRPKLIPFNVTIPEEERDPALPEKLAAEMSGILAWAVRGCLEWQQQGLHPPVVVSAATSTYRAEQDNLGEFLEQCCLIDPKVSVPAGDLYDAFKNWGGRISQKRFSKSLAERGYTTKDARGKPVRDGAGRMVYLGLGLLG